MQEIMTAPVADTVAGTTRDWHLPQNYRLAQAALAECQRVDECKDWADKAAAIAAYAKMARAPELEVSAVRIRLRAVRRIGEILQSHDGNGLPPGGDIIPKEKRLLARSIARIPIALFEAVTEGPRPPGVHRMGALGTINPRAKLKRVQAQADRAHRRHGDAAVRFRSEHRLLDFLIDRQPLRSVSVREAREWAQKYVRRAEAILIMTENLSDDLCLGDLVDETTADQAMALAEKRAHHGFVKPAS